MPRILPALALVGAVFAAPALAGGLEPVALAPLTHPDAQLQVIGPDGGETVYAQSDLEQLPTYSLTTATPWREVPATFEGVRLRDVLAANGLEGQSIAVTAENDYTTVLSAELIETVDILVATRVDGRAHTRRARGPIQFVIDQEVFETSDLTDEANYVWMVARIEPEG